MSVDKSNVPNVKYRTVVTLVTVVTWVTMVTTVTEEMLLLVMVRVLSPQPLSDIFVK